MKRNHSYPAVTVFVMLLAIVACMLPGQAAPPAPAMDPFTIETVVAGTAQAAEQQTQQANPVPATPTIASTATITPTPKISPSGTSLAPLADGSTQFIDYAAGMQMVFPPGWLAIRVGEEEYYAAWRKPETQAPMFANIFAEIQNLDPKVFRVNALDIRPEYIIYDNVTQVEVVFEQNDTRSLKEVKADETKGQSLYKDYKLLSSNLFDAPQGMQALNIEAQWASANKASQTGKSYSRRVIYKVSTGIIAVDLFTLLDKKDLTTPDFEQTLNSITFFNP